MLRRERKALRRAELDARPSLQQLELRVREYKAAKSVSLSDWKTLSELVPEEQYRAYVGCKEWVDMYCGHFEKDMKSRLKRVPVRIRHEVMFTELKRYLMRNHSFLAKLRVQIYVRKLLAMLEEETELKNRRAAE